MKDQLFNLHDLLEPEEIRLVELSLHLVAIDQIIEEWEFPALMGVDMTDVIQAHTTICERSEVSCMNLSCAYHCMNNICLGPDYLAEKSIDISKIDINALLVLREKVSRLLGKNLLFGWHHPTDSK